MRQPFSFAIHDSNLLMESILIPFGPAPQIVSLPYPCKSIRVMREFRGFAPIGMLEHWKVGIMGTGKMGNKSCCGGFQVLRFGKLLLTQKPSRLTFIFKPTFHYSIIPLFHVGDI